MDAWLWKAWVLLADTISLSQNAFILRLALFFMFLQLSSSCYYFHQICVYFQKKTEQKKIREKSHAI